MGHTALAKSLEAEKAKENDDTVDMFSGTWSMRHQSRNISIVPVGLLQLMQVILNRLDCRVSVGVDTLRPNPAIRPPVASTEGSSLSR